jgi:hypothetical protein
MQLDEPLTPDDLRAIADLVRAERGDLDGFDVVIAGATSGRDAAADAAIVTPYAKSGATWWLESIDPWRYGWAWQGDWPIAQMNDRIRRGPPRP